METLFTSPVPPATDLSTDLSNDIQSKDHYSGSDNIQSKDHYSGSDSTSRDLQSSQYSGTDNNDLKSSEQSNPYSGADTIPNNDPYSGSEKTPLNPPHNPQTNSQPSTPTNQYSSMKPPVKSSIPNHLKPNTIWHTAALPREEQPLDLRNEYDNIPLKKRRLEGGKYMDCIEIVRCQICCQHFDSPGHLIDHLIEHDSDYKYAPIYKCSYGQCNYRTDDRPSMKYHISHVHIKTNQMRVSKKYRNRKLLRPTILCSTCPMVFATEKELWDHTASCKDYRCQFCGQHFWTIEKRLAHEDMYHDVEEEEGEETENDASWAADVPDKEPAPAV